MNRALLVALEQYANVGGISGCHNDAEGMRRLLVHVAGFSASDVRTLQDSQATADAIRAALLWLVSGASSGDRIVFHYAGHGSELPINDAAHDVIVPYDFDSTPQRAVSDDDFTKAFQGVPADVDFYWVSDSCNSGGLTRLVSVRAQPRYLTPRPDIRIELARLKSRGQVRGIRAAAQTLNAVLFAACTSEEEANGYYIAGDYHGIFTYYLVATLRQAGSGTLSATALNRAVVTNVVAQFPAQHPELHGNPVLFSRPFLGGLVPTRMVSAGYQVDAPIEDGLTPLTRYELAQV